MASQGFSMQQASNKYASYVCMYTRIIPHYYVMFTELNLHAPAAAACNQTIQMHLTCSELNKKPCFVANCK